MRHFIVSGFGIFAALALMNGCSPEDKPFEGTTQQQFNATPTDQILPKYPSRYWEAELKHETAALKSDERDLLAKFMSRHVKTSPTIDQVPIPDGATIKQAIFAQRIVDMVTLQQEVETNALRELIRKQESEIAVLKEEVLRRDEVTLNSMSTARQQNPNVSMKNANGYNQARQNALINYGVPELERQLQISMQKDRADPRWAEFQTDSSVTASIRSRLIAARYAADQSVALRPK